LPYDTMPSLKSHAFAICLKTRTYIFRHCLEYKVVHKFLGNEWLTYGRKPGKGWSYIWSSASGLEALLDILKVLG